ncbi:hypothetical protein GCM10010508_48620 [Streptomyces naganishii JCM 4654]|uniref:Uncharacterized protein n=1 Tax=Streptomyces naganishii JCM 4654 TaxID=1306179 RepID=A0A919CXI5_9ACTN|nr:hypothetical protein GCM10010508_48620 [Streptomyces naganishii JCM 4654]
MLTSITPAAVSGPARRPPRRARAAPEPAPGRRTACHAVMKAPVRVAYWVRPSAVSPAQPM